tara:strand:+ start:730 stop:1785 length:1056 start_codon:yes stop_codon:yes gene_type:complete
MKEEINGTDTQRDSIPDNGQEARELPENYRPASTEGVPEGRACGNCYFYNELKTNNDGNKAYCEKWDAYVRANHYCNAWKTDKEVEGQGYRNMKAISKLEDKNKDQVKGNTLSKIEQRVNTTEFEVREESDGMHFSGYAALFDSPSEPLPFTERIAKGAFKRSLRSRNDIKFLWNHDSGEILGSTRAGTMSLVEDDRGLRVEGMLPQTSRGKDVAELLRRNDIDSMSFGFSVPQGGDTWNSDGSERTLKSVRLHEVSLVAWPAYTATAGTVSVRKYEKIAERADVNAEALADALGKIEDGLNITSDEQEMLSRVINTLAPEAEVVPEPVVTGDLSMLELKKKKLELLMKGI